MEEEEEDANVMHKVGIKLILSPNIVTHNIWDLIPTMWAEKYPYCTPKKYVNPWEVTKFNIY